MILPDDSNKPVSENLKLKADLLETFTYGRLHDTITFILDCNGFIFCKAHRNQPETIYIADLLG